MVPIKGDLLVEGDFAVNFCEKVLALEFIWTAVVKKSKMIQLFFLKLESIFLPIITAEVPPSRRTLSYFAPSFLDIKTKSSSQMERFFIRYFPHAFSSHRQVCSRFWTWKILWPNCSNFAVECDWSSKIFKMFKIRVFFEKMDGFFGKNIDFFAKLLNVVNLLKNAYQTLLFLKKVFLRFYGKINQKILNIGKLRKCDEEGVLFSGRKHFLIFKSLLHQYGKAQNMPVVAGGLVYSVLEKKFVKNGLFCFLTWKRHLFPDFTVSPISHTIVRGFQTLFEKYRLCFFYWGLNCPLEFKCIQIF